MFLTRKLPSKTLRYLVSRSPNATCMHAAQSTQRVFSKSEHASPHLGISIVVFCRAHSGIEIQDSSLQVVDRAANIPSSLPRVLSYPFLFANVHRRNLVHDTFSIFSDAGKHMGGLGILDRDESIARSIWLGSRQTVSLPLHRRHLHCAESVCILWRRTTSSTTV
ncbi:hypothetical protein C8R45DRAFT_1028399 [Mycena sanguinolenta]|nr:hypothetical protein C8R45DRAFT_1028399 [Mycena sanguinolenta]